MNILADFHHDALFYSLQLLFEKRLGYELYRPIGLEWYTEGYWNVYPHLDTAKQFLGLDQPCNKPRDIHGNELPPGARCNETYTVEGDTYLVVDPKRGVVQKGIELETFKNTKFDIIVSSIPQHIQPFNRLIQLYQPQAKHIFQVGNAWGHIPGVKNILASTAPFVVPADTDVCFYHQEFDLDQFCPSIEFQPNRIRSYIHFMQRKDFFQEVGKYLPGWDLGCHGASIENHPLDKGDIMKTVDLASIMKQSGFTWHFKPEGDGAGHVIQGAFASGSLPIVWPSQYRGKQAGDLMIPGKNCINAEGKTAQQLANELQLITEDSSRFLSMRKAAYERFKEVVDYDSEEKMIRDFLSRLS